MERSSHPAQTLLSLSLLLVNKLLPDLQPLNRNSLKMSGCKTNCNYRECLFVKTLALFITHVKMTWWPEMLPQIRPIRFFWCLCFLLQDGVNWLSFLNKYKLHGILCDDMGLGKTLQSICILAGDHYLRYKTWTTTLLLLLCFAFNCTASVHGVACCYLTRCTAPWLIQLLALELYTCKTC